MKYTEEMILASKSGYCMPFEEQDNNEVDVTLHYGDQVHPITGSKFFHHGVDFRADHYMLYAVADGIISGVGSDERYGITQTIRYGKYEITYGHLSNVFIQFGSHVHAGDVVALSGDMLHITTKFDGEEISPIDFLTMLYGNVKATQQQGGPMFQSFDMTYPTNYDADQKEIEKLMIKWLPNYFADMFRGRYTVPERTEQSLRNIFSLSAAKNYFFESVPSISNPLGITQRAMPLACKVQNLLIGDFLNYLALCQNVFLSSLDGDVKKKYMTRQLPTPAS